MSYGRLVDKEERIEAEAADKARRHAQDKERRRQERGGTSDEQAVTDAGDKAAAKARPKPKSQANFTDPDSRIMKNSDGAYIQAYNAQAVVDEKHQVITAADVTTNPSDALNYTTMLDQSAQNTGFHPRQGLVDAGYCSETNLEAAKDCQLACGTDTFMATGRLAHDEQVPPAPRGRIPASATLKERMARKLRTKPGKAAYSRRKVIVEPVFGQIVTCQNGRLLQLRVHTGSGAAVPGDRRAAGGGRDLPRRRAAGPAAVAPMMASPRWLDGHLGATGTSRKAMNAGGNSGTYLEVTTDGVVGR
jgi:hypothetical protein